jgi:hypothetical protein
MLNFITVSKGPIASFGNMVVCHCEEGEARRSNLNKICHPRMPPPMGESPAVAGSGFQSCVSGFPTKAFRNDSLFKESTII